MTEWERMQELVEEVFGEKPESPDELIGIMICMADIITDCREGATDSSRNLHLS